MTTYSLEIQFDSAGLATLTAAGQQVAIVKQTSPSAAPVVWVAFNPELDNTVTWTEVYSVYGSSTEVENGATIVTDSILQAVGGETFPFGSGQFAPGTANLPANEYGIQNLDPNFPLLTAGLAQASSGTIGDAVSPLNATLVPFNETGIYTPIEKVQVFALASANNGLVISSVVSNALLVDLTESTSQVIHYVDATNQFAMGPLAAPARAVRYA
jgi:hypothetical protein